MYQELEYDRMAGCNAIAGQNYFHSPDALIQHVLMRIAPLGDGQMRLKSLRAFIDMTLDDLAKQAVRDLLR